MIAIVFCSEQEARPFLKKYERGRFEGIQEGEILQDDKVVITLTGIGKIKAALRTERMLRQVKVSRLFHLGTCTGLTENQSIGELVAIGQVFEGDRIELSTPTYPRMPLAATDGLPAGTLVTQDHTPQGESELSYWQRIADYSDMSGYAIAYVTATYGVSCQIIKVITGMHFKDNANLHATLEKAYETLASYAMEQIQSSS